MSEVLSDIPLMAEFRKDHTCLEQSAAARKYAEQPEKMDKQDIAVAGMYWCGRSIAWVNRCDNQRVVEKFLLLRAL